jgi:hypothetical protein
MRLTRPQRPCLTNGREMPRWGPIEELRPFFAKLDAPINHALNLRVTKAEGLKFRDGRASGGGGRCCSCLLVQCAGQREEVCNTTASSITL